MPNDKSLRLCVDRVVPAEYQPARAQMEHALGAGDHGLGMTVQFMKKWPNGKELKCRFLDGTATQKKRVEEKAHMWEEFANIRFKFVPTGDAEIRISFSADPGSWSAVGTDALIEQYFPKFAPTMNYGWLVDDTEDEEYERVVVHEFGHSIGAVHEHQSPKSPLQWNKAEVYRLFEGPPNFWTKADIDHNIFKRYSILSTNSTKFDPKSIMLYGFPASLFKDGKGTESNTRMSALDKSFIKKMYPPKKP